MAAAQQDSAGFPPAQGGLPETVKPRLRGWLHAGAFPAAVAAGAVLITIADGRRAKIACSIFVATSLMLFGTSAVYHRGTWSPRAKAVLRRLDHANIFLIIAGTYTPFSLLLLHGTTSHALLAAVWGGALAGVFFRVFWLGAPRWLYTPCYIALGWAAIFFLPAFMRTGGVAVLVLVVVGGLLYSAGAIVYGLKKPNPSPTWFGFHELFHAFTIAAFTSHFVGISIVAAHA